MPALLSANSRTEPLPERLHSAKMSSLALHASLARREACPIALGSGRALAPERSITAMPFDGSGLAADIIVSAYLETS